MQHDYKIVKDEEIIQIPISIESPRYDRFKPENKNNPDYTIQEFIPVEVLPGDVIINVKSERWDWKVLISSEDFGIIDNILGNKIIKLRIHGGIIYAVTDFGGTKDSFHTIVSGAQSPLVANHINSFGLDNRRRNLQVVSQEINAQLHWSLEEKKEMLLDPVKFWSEKREFVIVSLTFELLSKPLKTRLKLLNEFYYFQPELAFEVFNRINEIERLKFNKNLCKYEYIETNLMKEYLDFYYVFLFGYNNGMKLLKRKSNSIQTTLF